MDRGKLRPFVDTNVLFSGLYSPSGAPAEILRLHVQGSLTIIVSRQVLDELISTVRAKKPEILPLLHAFLTGAPPEVSLDPDPAEVLRVSSFINATDAPIVVAALECHADCLVTGNTRHFTPEVARQAGIAIFTPAVYIATLSSL